MTSCALHGEIPISDGRIKKNDFLWLMLKKTKQTQGPERLNMLWHLDTDASEAAVSVQLLNWRVTLEEPSENGHYLHEVKCLFIWAPFKCVFRLLPSRVPHTKDRAGSEVSGALPWDDACGQTNRLV